MFRPCTCAGYVCRTLRSLRHAFLAPCTPHCSFSIQYIPRSMSSSHRTLPAMHSSYCAFLAPYTPRTAHSTVPTSARSAPSGSPTFILSDHAVFYPSLPPRLGAARKTCPDAAPRLTSLAVVVFRVWIRVRLSICVTLALGSLFRSQLESSCGRHLLCNRVVIRFHMSVVNRFSVRVVN